MTDIVEKVAMEIHNEFHADPDPRRGARTGFYFPGSPFGGMARVAIKATLEAIREPTEAQIKNGWKVHDGRLATSYTAMIDQLIKEMDKANGT